MAIPPRDCSLAIQRDRGLSGKIADYLTPRRKGTKDRNFRPAQVSKTSVSQPLCRLGRIAPMYSLLLGELCAFVRGSFFAAPTMLPVCTGIESLARFQCTPLRGRTKTRQWMCAGSPSAPCDRENWAGPAQAEAGAVGRVGVAVKCQLPAPRFPPPLPPAVNMPKGGLKLVP